MLQNSNYVEPGTDRCRKTCQVSPKKYQKITFLLFVDANMYNPLSPRSSPKQGKQSDLPPTPLPLQANNEGGTGGGSLIS